ncbi:hypothetical protein, partial [Escherichia coli]|uniref:hypothetical protein n=1 Tax=Escherichia coli TaxID=562 RepID=UPI002867A701
LSDNRDQSSQSLDFMDQQLDARQKQLADAEAKRADFQNRYLGSLPGTGSIDDRVSAARTQLAQISRTWRRRNRVSTSSTPRWRAPRPISPAPVAAR